MTDRISETANKWFVSRQDFNKRSAAAKLRTPSRLALRSWFQPRRSRAPYAMASTGSRSVLSESSSISGASVCVFATNM
jgi:hypothetical protein